METTPGAWIEFDFETGNVAKTLIYAANENEETVIAESLKKIVKPIQINPCCNGRVSKKMTDGPMKTDIENDPVTHPSHYTQGKIEVLDFILDQNLNYLAGNIVKYICRYRFKGASVQDLKKARFYLNQLIVETEAEAGAVNANHGPFNCQGVRN